MAGGQKVTLTFAGDSSDLERTFDKVGSSAKAMGTKTESAIDKIGTASTRAGRTAKGLQGALGGLVASGQGVRAIMEGDVLGGLLMLEGGFGRTALSAAKLARNIAQTAIQFVASGARMVASMATTVASTVAGWVVMGVQAMVNAAKMAVAWLISLGPIGLVIAAIGAVIAILVALGLDFDDLKRIAGAAWEFILGAAQGVWNWIKDNWPLILAILTGPIGLAVLAIQNHWETIKSGASAVVESIVGFFTAIPGRLAGFISAMASKGAEMGSAFLNGLKGVVTGVGSFASDVASGLVNALKSAWNSFARRVNGLIPNSLGWGPASINLPDDPIPTFHMGGVFRAPAGRREGLAMLLDGETVSRPGQGGMPVVQVYIDGALIMESMRGRIRVQHGGNVQNALGSPR